MLPVTGAYILYSLLDSSYFNVQLVAVTPVI
nr:MAG TPA: hypothetical protein [Crassvirales sp.]